MANLKEIRKRITSVKNTQQITKAMKMVAAAKLRRAQESMMQGRPYAKQLQQTIDHLSQNIDREAHPLLREAKGSKTLLLVITSDRGLCGAFNSSLNRTAERFVADNKDKFESIDLAIIGRKGNDYLKRRAKRQGFQIAHFFSDVYIDFGVDSVRKVTDTIVADFIEGKYDQLFILFNEFKSVIAQITQTNKLLPIEPIEESTSSSADEFEYEPAKEELLNHLLPLHLNTQIYRALRESIASEMGARMTAMDSASNNASDMIADLTLQFNRARQAAITTELIEIISGASAL